MRNVCDDKTTKKLNFFDLVCRKYLAMPSKLRIEKGKNIDDYYFRCV